MDHSIEYLGNYEDLDIIEAPLWWHKQGLRQTASGFGRKLTTAKKVRYNGRYYRIYCCQISNAGSQYIIAKGKILYLR